MFPDKCLSFRLDMVYEFPKIDPTTFRPFIDHLQGLLVCVRCVLFFKNVF